MKKINYEYVSGLVKTVIAGANFYEQMKTEEEVLDSLYEIEPIKNMEGNYEFLLYSHFDPDWALFLIITPNDVYLECQNNKEHAQSSLKDCFAKRFLMKKYQF